MKDTIRGSILDTAKELTTGDRNKSYGEPAPNLNCYAHMVEAYLDLRYPNMKQGAPLNSVDGAILMVLAKVSRVAVNQKHPDNYVDMAAYAAIAGECSEVC